jgi:hypothetical protein
MPVIIGMDPHKRSAAIEVINELGEIIMAGKFGADQLGYAEMLAAGRRFSDRVWAVEDCNGVGRHIAHRLVHDGETVLDVPAKLSAQVRCSPPATAARPTLWTRTPSPWPRCALRTWFASRPTPSWS